MDEEATRAALETALGHRMADPTLLRDALTHRSFANERPRLAPRDNERLEFLGDALIGVVVASLLHERFPQAPEGELTRRRADLVCEAALAEVARDVGVGPAMRLGKGEDRSGGRDKPRLLASAFEACMGAVFLDGGPAVAVEVGRRLFEPRIDVRAPGATDFKSRAQELAQALGLPPPTYEIVRSEGPDHDRRFFVQAVLDGAPRGEGEGRSKLEAEQAAAEAALPWLEGGSP